MIPSHFVRVSLFAGFAVTTALGSPVFAASQCKGLAESACATDDGCRWIAAYERSDGRQVSAHCRLAKAAKQAARPKAMEAQLSSTE